MFIYVRYFSIVIFVLGLKVPLTIEQMPARANQI